jgi:hypothetical protein
MATLGPAATTLPLRTTTVPPCIGSDPSPVTSVPLVIATVWAASGEEINASAKLKPVRVERSRNT